MGSKKFMVAKALPFSFRSDKISTGLRRHEEQKNCDWYGKNVLNNSRRYFTSSLYLLAYNNFHLGRIFSFTTSCFVQV